MKIALAFLSWAIVATVIASLPALLTKWDHATVVLLLASWGVGLVAFMVHLAFLLRSRTQAPK